MSLLGIDIGTSGCKAGAFSADGRCLGMAYREYPTLHPQPGRAELDSRLVMQQVEDTIREVAAATDGDPVTALCVSAMGEAMTPVSETGEILGNAILSADERGADYVERLAGSFGQDAFYAINPNILAPHYSLPKLLWLREHEPTVYNNAWKFLLWGELATFLFGGDAVTSYSHANRTMLFDIHRQDWSDCLLAWADIPREKLPATAMSGTVTGRVSSRKAAALGLPPDVDIVLGGHDQCLNALGAGIITGGKAVCGIGTIECITPVFDFMPEPGPMCATGLSIEHHVLPDLYLSFIYNQSGVLLKWCRDTLAVADAQLLADGEDIYDALLREMPDAPTGMLVLPHFENTGAPEYITDSAGVIAGLHTSTNRGDILKAVIEGATYYFLDSIQTIADRGIDTSEFIATGGPAKSDAILQIKADIFGAPFVRLTNTECGIAGAAMLAGVATGVFNNVAEAVTQFVVRDRVFAPHAARHEQYRDIFERYARLYPALKTLLADMRHAQP